MVSIAEVSINTPVFNVCCLTVRVLPTSFGSFTISLSKHYVEGVKEEVYKEERMRPKWKMLRH